ncbi:phosphatase PAP2 family protein [Falsiroseomonas sp. E2-1-a20]|uniref:phosphatase PAP2 family protein n=1 Tax=Falsiroseomonas sp. E2-1-a20 TaxID=3239300 RepID=UPI003F2C1630
MEMPIHSCFGDLGGGMLTLDESLFLLINGWVGTSWSFDHLVFRIAHSHLLKGSVLVALLWWSWHRAQSQARASVILRTVVGVLMAVAVARAMQNLLPARLRPAHDPALLERGFVLFDEFDPAILEGLSSFPSDHAVLAFAMATAVFLEHRRLGIVAMVWALLTSCLPRVYLGMRYPGDIIAGAIVGTLVMLAVASLPVPQLLDRRVETLALRHRGLFYAVLFLATSQMATVFVDSRALFGTVANLVLLHLPRL